MSSGHDDIPGPNANLLTVVALATILTEYYVKWQFLREEMLTYTYIPHLIFCDQDCRMGEVNTCFYIFPFKINPTYGCHGIHIWLILGKIAVVKRGVVDIHIHTKFVSL